MGIGRATVGKREVLQSLYGRGTQAAKSETNFYEKH